MLMSEKKNLESINDKLNTILKQTDTISADWEREKELNLGNQGYLNLATNFPEIMDEISLIKWLINSFNKGRKNLWRYKDSISSYNSGNLYSSK